MCGGYVCARLWVVLQEPGPCSFFWIVFIFVFAYSHTHLHSTLLFNRYVCTYVIVFNDVKILMFSRSDLVHFHSLIPLFTMSTTSVPLQSLKQKNLQRLLLGPGTCVCSVCWCGCCYNLRLSQPPQWTLLCTHTHTPHAHTHARTRSHTLTHTTRT